MTTTMKTTIVLVLLWAAAASAQPMPPVPAATLTIRPGEALPNPIPAGSVIDIIGTYAVNHTSPNTLKINGTAGQPVIIKSYSPLERSIVSGAWEVTGGYYTLQNLTFTSGIGLVAPNIWAILRDSEIKGNGITCLGAGVDSYDPLAKNRFIFFLRNWVHDHGDLKATGDQDCHGLKIGERAEDVWIDGNVLDRNSGDGLQINSGTSRSARRIYVTGNTARGNKQSGLWSKQATDVVFARNTVSNHRPSNSSLGACVGGQYGPENFWIVDNVLSDCDYGVQLASDVGDGADGKVIVVMGNTISNIRDTDASDARQGPAWASAAIAIMGGTAGGRYIAGNTVTTSTRAISVNGSAYVDLAGMLQSLRDYFLKYFGR